MDEAEAIFELCDKSLFHLENCLDEKVKKRFDADLKSRIRCMCRDQTILDNKFLVNWRKVHERNKTIPMDTLPGPSHTNPDLDSLHLLDSENFADIQCHSRTISSMQSCSSTHSREQLDNYTHMTKVG